MDQKLMFQEALSSFVDLAATKGNRVTMEDVHSYFKDFINDDSQYQFIYDYLSINKISVDGFHKPLNRHSETTVQNTFDERSPKKESEHELSFIQMYLSDLKNIAPAREGEVEQLLGELLNGNTDVINRLIECHLPIVAEIAKTYQHKGVHFGDLIQEGNIGLMLALSDYNKNSGDFLPFITERINQSMEDIINEQINSDRVGAHLADKLNQLDKITKQLNEDLGRIPEIAEIANAMNISEDEVSLLLKTSLDTLSVNEDV